VDSEPDLRIEAQVDQALAVTGAKEEAVASVEAAVAEVTAEVAMAAAAMEVIEAVTVEMM